MAATYFMPLHAGKRRKVHESIARVIRYVENPEKTENGVLVTRFAY